MGIKLTNNAFATLAAGINSSATSITLTSGQGARFPTLTASDYFYATLVDTSNNLEIVKCTARSTDVLTVVRAQESTTARAYNTGDRIEIRITAATFLDAVNEQDGDKGDITVSSSGSIWTIDNNAVTTAKINNDAVTAAKFAGRIKQLKTGGRTYSAISNGSTGDLKSVQFHSNPFSADSGMLLIAGRSLVKLATRGSTTTDAYYMKVFKNASPTSGQFTSAITGTDIGSNVNDTNMGFRIGAGNFESDGWTNLTFSIYIPHTAGDTYTFYAQTDNLNCVWNINEFNVDFVLFTGITVV
jgi:hypothetical protein